MAIPKAHDSIGTNLPLPRLEKVLEALEKGATREVPGSHSLFNESRAWKVDFEGAIYEIQEFVEEVSSVRVVVASPALVASLIAELEAELSIVVGKRKYGTAEKINEKIKNLQAKWRV
ncbi:MAG: hypothetical protein NUV60_01190 [Patescibacteria group bacterium]|nr:hypothetical protein [Patescibacteria group bacterium]